MAIAGNGEHVFGKGIGAESPLSCNPRPVAALGQFAVVMFVVPLFVVVDAAGRGVKPFVVRMIEVGLSRAGAREHANVVAMHPEVDAAQLLFGGVLDLDQP